MREYTQVADVDPKVVWERWTNPDLWPEDDPTLANARFHGPLAVGSLGWIRPKKGVRQPMKLTVVDMQGRRFAFESAFVGAVMLFEHELDAEPDGRSSLTHRITFRGPLAKVWNRYVGRAIGDNFPTVVGNIIERAGRGTPTQPPGA